MRTALWALAVLGALAFGYGVAADPARTWGVFLVNFLFWSGVAQAAVAFSAILHLTRARWGTPLRPLAEGMAAFMPVSFALALLLPLGHRWLYGFLPTASARERWWLSAPFVTTRLLVGLLLLYGASLLFVHGSRQRDAAAQPERGRASRDRLAPLVVIAFGVVLSLESFDWVMSLDPLWSSTLVGGHFFVGSLYGALAALALAARLGRTRGEAQITPSVRHDLGKLLLAFCMLWTYMVFVQYIVIWYGDLPEETAFVLRRTRGAWAPVAAAVLASCFLIPFPLLLSRGLKRHDTGLAAVAALALAGLWTERFLQVVPSLGDGAARLDLVGAAVTAAFFAAFALCYARGLTRPARERVSLP